MPRFLSRLRRMMDRLFPFQNLPLARSSLDPMLLYGDIQTEKRSLVVAGIAACSFHLFLFLVVDLPARRTIFEPAKQVLVLAKLVEPRPGTLKGGFQRPAVSHTSVPRPVSVLVPIPDPSPPDPEPIRRPDVSLIPPTVNLSGDDLTIGVIGPPSVSPEQAGNGGRDQAGGDLGDAPRGNGEALYGPDISLPVLISHRLPQYSDEAIKAHIEGVVFLRAVVRKNGKADSFEVVRGLGYGLEERAIQEIARSWTFRPATRRGVAIDYPTLIEVTFSLR